MQNFKVACEDWASTVSGFNDKAKKEIAEVIDGHLATIATKKVSGSTAPNFTHSVAWDLTSDKLEPHDVVIYFVPQLIRSRSVKKGFLKTTETPDGTQGLTLRVPPTGKPFFVICEVFVESNFPTKRLGNAAFHELMHTKLDIGTDALSDMHGKAGGLGLTTNPTLVNDALTDINIKLMRAHMFKAVPMYTKDM